MRRLIAGLTVTASVALLTGCGQLRSSAEAGATVPSPRASAGVAYDAARGNVVLFGGGAATWLGDTWTWDGRSWQQQKPSAAPSPRGAAAMAFDPSTGRVILFGGIGERDRSGETKRTDMWAWDGTTWTQLHPAAVPPATFGGALMAFDPVSQHVILLVNPGDGSIPRNQTWEWTGATWVLVDSNGPIGDGPPGLSQNPPAGLQDRPRLTGYLDPSTVLSLDPVHNRLMVVQGVQYADAPVHGVVTWEWDGHHWVVVDASSAAFTSQSGHIADPMLAPEPGGGSVLLIDIKGAWRWDGARWAAVPSTLPARGRAALVLDRNAGQDLLFGGISANSPGGFYGETWTWSGSAWNRIAGPTGPQAAQFPTDVPPAGGITRDRAIAIARGVVGGPGTPPVIQARLARAGALGEVYPTTTTWEWGVSFRVDQTIPNEGGAYVPPDRSTVNAGSRRRPSGTTEMHSVVVFIDYLSGQVLMHGWPAPRTLGGEGP